MITKLYDLFKPDSYKLHLNIDSERTQFSGRVDITGNLDKESHEVLLHAKDLTITAASINGARAAFNESEFDTLHLVNESALATGKVEVVVEFTGVITDAMHGMYPCYFEHEGKKKKLIATQFESHHAREVFPCVDEPAAKATFDVELVTSEGETVLSNMPIKKQESVVDSSELVEKGKTLQTTFETTPIMSTYLLAFVVGEMVSKEAVTKDGVVVKSWASAAQDPSWLDYSVKETVDLIEFYNEYFGVPYPLAKCDQVALPDFESGAMENWGLITYRETVLLSDPENPSLSTQQWVTLVVAHELSHQWFGNLVTMEWWDDLWLNESFANMTEYLAADRLHPEWQIWEEFVSHDAASATNRDVYQDVQAVRVRVDNPSEIHTLFDPSIVYAKGGKLLRMLHDLLGDDAWRAGLKLYFEKHQYKNTSRDDLWNALSSVSDIDVPALMNTWIEKPGQPLISVTQKNQQLKLTQKRLLLDGKDDALWQVPLLAKGAPLLFSEKESSFTLETAGFTRLNQSGVGHYITNYTEPDHKAWISKELSDPKAASEWKITYLNGLIMLARYGETNLSEALEAVKESYNEPRAAVWSLISTIIGSARMIIEGEDTLEDTVKLMSYRLAEKHLKRLGWQYFENEPSNDVHLRTTIIGLAVASENEAVIQTALALYKSSDDPEKLPAEIRSIVMGVAVRFGEKAEFARLIELYKQSSNAEYKADICAALCSTRDPQQATKLAELMLDTSVIRTQDTIRWYVYLLRNRYVRSIAWQWLVDNWDWVMEHFGGSKSYDDFARYSASLLSTDRYLAQYKAFFEPKASDPALKRAITIGIHEITTKNEWRKRDQTAVTAWLNDYSDRR